MELRVSVAIDIQTEAAAMEDSFEGVDKAPPTMARGSDWNEVSALDPEKAAASSICNGELQGVLSAGLLLTLDPGSSSCRTSHLHEWSNLLSGNRSDSGQ